MVLGVAAAARVGGASIAVPPNCWPVFGYLLAAPRREAQRDALAMALWPDHESDAARHSLASALYRIKSAFGDLACPVEASGERLRLRLDGTLWVDMLAFERRAAPLAAIAGTVSLDPAARRRLHRALHGYGGDFMPMVDAEWALIERERLRCLRLDALYALAGIHARADDWGAVVATTRALTAAEPLREDAHRLLMTGYARTGNRALALRQYRHCATVLAAELGVEPMDETSALYRSLCAPSGRAVIAPPTPPMAVPVPGSGDLREVLVATRDQMRTAIGLIDHALAGP
jgi:DNA-binding SARP family transcriptional activator